MWEWFLHSSVLKWTEFDLSKINWLRGVILLIPIVLVFWNRFSLCHSYQTYFGFPRSDLNLNCRLRDHMIMKFASVGIRARLRNKVISFCCFRFFCVPLSFSVFASFIFLFFVSASSKQKKSYIRMKKCCNFIFYVLGARSHHISNLNLF